MALNATLTRTNAVCLNMLSIDSNFSLAGFMGRRPLLNDAAQLELDGLTGLGCASDFQAG